MGTLHRPVQEIKETQYMVLLIILIFLPILKIIQEEILVSF